MQLNTPNDVYEVCAITLYNKLWINPNKQYVPWTSAQESIKESYRQAAEQIFDLAFETGNAVLTNIGRNIIYMVCDFNCGKFEYYNYDQRKWSKKFDTPEMCFEDALLKVSEVCKK